MRLSRAISRFVELIRSTLRLRSSSDHRWSPVTPINSGELQQLCERPLQTGSLFSKRALDFVGRTEATASTTKSNSIHLEHPARTRVNVDRTIESVAPAPGHGPATPHSVSARKSRQPVPRTVEEFSKCPACCARWLPESAQLVSASAHLSNRQRDPVNRALVSFMRNSWPGRSCAGSLAVVTCRQLQLKVAPAAGPVVS